MLQAVPRNIVPCLAAEQRTVKGQQAVEHGTETLFKHLLPFAPRITRIT